MEQLIQSKFENATSWAANNNIIIPSILAARCNVDLTPRQNGQKRRKTMVCLARPPRLSSAPRFASQPRFASLTSRLPG